MRCGLVAILAVSVIGLLTTRHASAQASASTGAALALFDDGVRLMEEGKYAEACPKLARSQEVSPNGGTLFTLADCYEKSGKLASAWVAYKEAAVRAQVADKPEAERRALDAVQALTPKVTWVKLAVTDVPGLAVFRDGQEVARAEWSVAVPLDPGTHRVEARARGRKPWSSDIRVSAVGAQLLVDVPNLEADGERSAATKDVVEPASSWSTQHYVGLGIAGVGVAGLVVGTLFGLRSSSKNDEAAAHCVEEKFCDDVGLRLDSEGRSAGAVSTVAFIAGGAALAGGAIVFFTAPRSRPAAATAAAGPGVRFGGAGVPTIGGAPGTFALRMTGSF